MFCYRCGAQMDDHARFCGECGAPAAYEQAPANPAKESREKMVTPNIMLCEDGFYRWEYDLNLFTNPSIFMLIWRIFFSIISAIFLFIFIVDIFDSVDFFWDGFLNLLKFYGWFVLGMTGLVIVGYLIYAAIMRGKYCVLFEMNEKGVSHRQVPWQAKRAAGIAELAGTAGLATGRHYMAGAAASTRTEMYSDFSRVKHVWPHKWRHLIKVNSLFSHNQVYAKKEDFDFVKKFIIEHTK